MSESNPTPEPHGIPAWTLGWRLQRALAHAGLDTQQMADEIGVSRSTVSRWINDNGTPPRAGFVKLFAMRCGVPYVWLQTGEEATDGPDDPAGLGISGSGCIPHRSEAADQVFFLTAA